MGNKAWMSYPNQHIITNRDECSRYILFHYLKLGDDHSISRCSKERLDVNVTNLSGAFTKILYSWCIMLMSLKPFRFAPLHIFCHPSVTGWRPCILRGPHKNNIRFMDFFSRQLFMSRGECGWFYVWKKCFKNNSSF